MTLQTVYQDYFAALCLGNEQRALHIAQSTLRSGVSLYDLYTSVIQPALSEIGRLWGMEQITVAQEHAATAITERVMAHMYYDTTSRPSLQRMVVSALGRKLVATCVCNEWHDLGLRMVADLFAIEGWEAAYLGANMPIDDVVQMVNAQQAMLLAISVTLSSNIVHARDLIQAVRASAIGPHLKIIVGGQVFKHTPLFAHQIGADFKTNDPRAALRWIAHELA